jgi:hypothetical protein
VVELLGWSSRTHDPRDRAGSPRQSDLDALMQQVLAHRDDNWKKLQQ